MLLLNYDRTYGAKLNYTTGHRYYFDKYLSLYWPLRGIRYPYLPYDLLDLWPTEHHLRKIRKMLTLSYDPVFGHKYYQHVPFSKYYIDYNIRGPMEFYEPIRKRKWYPHYWPSHLMDYSPSDYSVRSLRLRNHLYRLVPNL